jgi:hypothetical protein
MIERVDLDHFGAGRRARRTARSHQARDLPAGATESLRRSIAKSPGGPENQNV